MNKREIIDELARDRAVERMAGGITRRPIAGELCDLCQIVYLYLLEYDDDKLVDLYENGQLGFFIVRVLLNQYRSAHSRFYYDFVKWGRMAAPVELAANKGNDIG